VILGIETSCDETAAAVVTPGGEILANVVASQVELHARFGGVVPEIAARRHLELVTPVVRQALDTAGTSLDHVELVAVTQGPGLIGALLVGLSAAKALAWGLGCPLAPVATFSHVASLCLHPEPLEPPFLCLLHQSEYPTPRRPRDRYTVLDRALGARRGSPTRAPACSGSAIREGRRSTLAAAGDERAVSFPVAKVGGLDFSFSGIKTRCSTRA
jgi:N6-L-threonylcarbamoyladenine synthase